MKKIHHSPLYTILLAAISLFFVMGCGSKNETSFDAGGNDKYDFPDRAAEFQRLRTRDITTGKVPTEKMWDAVLQTKQLKESLIASTITADALVWSERGSNSDAVGPSNGNTRANAGVTSGRIDAIWVDLSDASGKTVWVGGDMGGVWKTTDITASAPNWVLVNDFIGNLVVSSITQDPTNHNTMYFSTGELYYGGEVGIGVFKSTDHGVTWNLLPGTSSFIYSSKILCDNTGNVYLATRGSGLQRSTNGGTSWTNITPTGTGTTISDLELSSNGRMHIVTGVTSTQLYRFTDAPATATSASGWVSPTTTFTSGSQRAEIGVNGDRLYALPSVSSQVPAVWKSTDGGANWTNMGTPPVTVSNSPFANGQGWYDLAVAINPANPDECIIGGIDNAKTINGGTTWTRISAWVGTSGQYVHADQHTSVWYDGGNKILFGCDGGIHYSSDGGVTIRDRNVGLRIKEFYACAIHPVTTNYFLAGAQDNGTHQFTSPGIGASVEVLGGDGGYVAIDQDEPQFQTGTYVYANFRRSANGGATWSSNGSSRSDGQFINPYDYDNLNNRVYAGTSAGQYLRWDNPQTGFTLTQVPLAALNSGSVASVCVSPYTANRVFFGTTGGTLARADNAEATPSGVTLSTGSGMPGGYLNCINLGSTEQNMVVTFSNYNLTNVWISTNGGTTWTGVDGNLPNMPVYWAMFHPDDNTKMYIATETGVWETDLLNGASTAWTTSPSFPTVRTTMLKYRSSDRTILASTYGRGLWTSTVPLPTGFSFGSTTPATATCPAPATMNVTLPTISNGGFTNPITLSAISGVPGGTTISFGTNPVTPGNSSVVTLNNSNTLSAGSYTVTIQGVAAGAPNQTRDVTFTINPGTGPAITTHPSGQTVCEGQNVAFSVVATGTYQWQVSTNGGGSWSNISGQTTSSYSITGVTAALNNNQYRCVVSNLCGSTNSNAAVLTVNSAGTITAHPTDLNLCAGNAASFCVTASGTGLTYQWESSPAGCAGTWTNISGAISSCYNITTVTAGMNNTAYRCKVTSTCGPTTVTSNCALLTVVTSVTVTTQPVNQTVCDGTNTSFTVAGSGSGVIYQWQVNTGSGFTNISNGGVYSGATAATLTITGVTTAMSSYQYRCQLSNSTCTTPGISNAATLTVNALPAVTTNPISQTICAGSNVTFKVIATGNGITYQWQVNTGSGFTNITNGGVYSGANQDTLNITGATVGLTGYQYRCVVSGACSPAANSSAATLTVHAPVTITSSPAGAEVCSGANASFTVAGSSVPAIIYQWQVSTDGGTIWTNLAGANAATYTASGVVALMNNNRYRCLLSNGTCIAPVASNPAILTVRQLPTVGLTAAPLTSLLPGQTTTLTATPSASTGGTLTTAWTLNSNQIAVTGNTLPVTVANLGAYQVSIRETWPSSLFCSSLSQIVTIDASISDRLFIFPSPNDGNFSVSYYNNGGSNTQRRIVIFDSKGASVFDKQFPVSGPYTIIPVNLERATRGIYYVVVGDANGKKLTEGKVHVR